MYRTSALSVFCLGLTLIFGGCTTTAEKDTAPKQSVRQQTRVRQARAPRPFVQDIEDTALTFDMVGIPGGVVTIDTASGSEEVAVDPFWISPVELTWDIYDVFFLRLDRRRSAEGIPADAVTRPTRPYLPPDRGFGHNGYPAISVSLHGAKTFCQWLSLKTGKTYRLPTEAEWKHACQLGQIDPANVNDYGWHIDNADYATNPVGSKTSAANGLFDMYGNVSEWCTTLDGQGVVMGGSYMDSVDELGCAMRVADSSDWNESDPQIPKGQWWLADAGFIGFRIVCEP